ncbi:UspA domain-containing protein [Pandoraea horticolens]|uniref:UspA domain-containing protein n=1 Tax=Pandoraea horticolens TaxID=2508298 RepID=A0A5E4WC70_9BURK|nr:universal stress protein [Pandoraea horticolens]VVE22372.1 UspA domain-containing protein [Pandoraea horticolens]
MEPVSQLLSPHGIPKPFRRILVAVDPAGASQNAVAYTTRLCTHETQVLVLGFFEDPAAYLKPHSRTPADMHQAFNELREDELLAMERAKVALQRSGASVHPRLLGRALGNRDISAGIARVANEWNADLVVVGAEPADGLFATLTTRVSGVLAEHTHRAILVIPERAIESSLHLPRRILFAVDGSDASLSAVRTGMQLAPAHAQLLAVYVKDQGVDMSDPKEFLRSPSSGMSRGELALESATTLMSEQAPNATIERRLSHAGMTEDVAAAIVRETREWEADLVVIGAQDREGLSSWFNGHENERVARVIDRPLLIVNGAG